VSKRRRIGEILTDLFSPHPTLQCGPTMTVRRGRYPWAATVYRDSRFDLRQECSDCQGSGIDPASSDHDEPDLPCASCAGTGVITLDPVKASSAGLLGTDTYVSTIAHDDDWCGDAA
jgi:hypothetical protein